MTILYKYKGLSDKTTNHVIDLITEQLFFCHAKLLNDPYEGRIIGESMTQNLFQNTAVLSLSRTYDNLLMWSHYANSHYGFCFGFDNDKILESVNKDLDKLKEPFFEHGDVLYSSSMPKVTTSLANTTAKDVIFNKSTGWAYEQEYRYVVSSKRKIKLVSDSLKEVYVGAAIPIWNEKYDSIWNELSKLGSSVSIKVLGVGSGNYGLEIKDEFAAADIKTRIQDMIDEKGWR